MEIAKFYTDAFFKDFALINCKYPEIVSPATDNIDMYIKMIERLISDNYAYVSGGNVYFDISKLKDYYVLTNHQEDKMVVGARAGVEEDDRKRNQADFALWFTISKFENHELLWDSPWGKGYPGWHIECSGISIKYLGEYLDIHGGGVDNIFPHHTNEIAQSESYLGHKWCNYWFHNEHLLDESGKMSKSNGAILTVSSLVEQGYDPLAFRFMCLNSHYRKQLVFSYDALKQAEDTLNKLKNKISNLNSDDKIDKEKYDLYIEKFKKELESDLNTANAITVLYDLLKDNAVNETTKLELINSIDKVFSLDLVKKEKLDDELVTYIEEKIEERKLAKQNKDFDKADKIREELLNKGIEIKDTREGTVYNIIK